MAVTFDGTNDYLRKTSELVGSAGRTDSPKFLFSTWYQTSEATNAGNLIVGSTSGGNQKLQITHDTVTGEIQVFLRDNADSVLWFGEGPSSPGDGDWHHLAVSVDLTSGLDRRQVYFDRAALSMTDTTGPTSGSIGFSACNDWVVGAFTDGGAELFDGNMYDLLFWPGLSVDLSDADVLARLISSDGLTDSDGNVFANPGGSSLTGKPVGYGERGALASGDGTPASIYFSGAFAKNLGTGGAFTLNGQFAKANDPQDYRQAALWSTPGQRWFDSDQSGFSYPRAQTITESREGLTTHGQRIGTDEVDAPTRLERPSVRMISLINQSEEEDHEDDR